MISGELEIRIAILHMGLFYNGGGERTVLSQAIELKKRGHEVKVFSPTVTDECFPELRSEIQIDETAKVLPKEIPLRSGLGMIYSSLIIPYRQLSYFDVIVAHGQPSCWIAMNVKKRYRTPYVAYLHQINRFFSPRKVDKQFGWGVDNSIKFLEVVHRGNVVLKEADSCTVRFSDLVLSNSGWIKKKIRQYYKVEAQVLHPGVDTEHFVPKKGVEEHKYILSTNRHYPQKRLDYLIRCIKLISKSVPDVRCIVTGAYTKHSQDLIKLAEHLKVTDNIVFTGNLPSEALIRAYQTAYIYTFTSPEEDFGLGPLEAAACGVPSIVWDYAGPRETVVDGETGFRVKPYCLEKMAERHIELFENEVLRDSMGHNALQFVENGYTWSRHVATLEKHLEELC
jgi:glycosyltransferase involved in cell wall biosynthesis